MDRNKRQMSRSRSRSREKPSKKQLMERLARLEGLFFCENRRQLDTTSRARSIRSHSRSIRSCSRSIRSCSRSIRSRSRSIRCGSRSIRSRSRSIRSRSRGQPTSKRQSRRRSHSRHSGQGQSGGHLPQRTQPTHHRHPPSSQQPDRLSTNRRSRSQSPIDNVRPTDENLVIHVEDDISPTFLEAVGMATSAASTATKITISPHVVNPWLDIMCKGLVKEDRHKLLHNYQPENPPELFKSPSINAEVIPLLPVSSKVKDTRLFLTQQSLVAILTANASALKLVANLQVPMEDKEVLGTTISDVGKLTSDAFRSLTYARRDALFQYLSPSIRDMASKVPATTLLFGDNMVDEFKKQKSMESISKQIKATPSANFSRPSIRRTTRAAPPNVFTSSSTSSSANLNRRSPIRQRGGARSSGQTRPKSNYQFYKR